jgi:ribosomal protein L9
VALHSCLWKQCCSRESSVGHLLPQRVTLHSCLAREYWFKSAPIRTIAYRTIVHRPSHSERRTIGPLIIQIAQHITRFNCIDIVICDEMMHMSSPVAIMNRCRGMLLSQRPLLLCLRQYAEVQSQQHYGRRCMGHTVRIIVTQDVSEGKLYSGDISTVKAGYARNFLIPQKKAVYATRQNFVKLNLKDPELETAEELQARLEREAVAGDDRDLKAADILRAYLSNKVVSTIFKRHGSISSFDIAPNRLKLIALAVLWIKYM